jgi:hypothetical protein
MQQADQIAVTYEPPAFRVLGAIHDVTLGGDKTNSSSDGMFLMGVGVIGNASV